MWKMRCQWCLRQGDEPTNIPVSATISSSVAMPVWRRNSLMSVWLLVCLILLACAACTVSIARADVDMTGRLVPGPAPKSSLSSSGLEAEPLVNSEHDGVYHCGDPYSTIANVAGGLAIGNCPSNEEFDVEDYGYGGEKSGYFYGGYFANLGACAWAKVSEVLNKEKSGNTGHCSGGIGYEYGTFYKEINSNSAQDGFYVVNRVACEEYANVRPWGNDTAVGPIRNVPAYTAESDGAVNPALKWRYVTNNGKYVMVRDTRIGGGEGNWVFVERSCLPGTLPASEGEHLPPAPTAITAGYTNVTTTSATLNAEVNPNSVETKYFFEYGTTTGYGSETPLGNAGAGTTGVPVDAEITNLAPNTTYYYRIVASSAIGETVGGPVSFTTPPLPPTVTTGTATEIKDTQATLHGTVNPNGAETSYYLQYGETTAYGKQIPLTPADIGSGSGNVEVAQNLTELAPTTTYHYRLVAANAGGTSIGEDATFRTATEVGVFYQGSSNKLWETYYAYGSWAARELSGEMKIAADTSPSALFTEPGEVGVFYQGSNNELSETYYTPEKWPTRELSGEVKMAAGTSPSAIVTEPGVVGVFYQGSNNELSETYYASGKWTTRELGGKMAAKTSPSAILTEPGEVGVFYQGSNHELSETYYTPEKWPIRELLGKMAEGTSPSALITEPGVVGVFYQGSNNEMSETYYAYGSWAERELGGKMAAKTSPSAILTEPGEVGVFYQGSNNVMSETYYAPEKWPTRELGGKMAEGTSPSALSL